MSSSSSKQSSGSEQDSRLVIDQQKRKRMLSNRESAKRSRMRKRHHLDELCNQVAQLSNENSKMQVQIDLLSQQCLCTESENTDLRTQMMELIEKLQSANCVLRFVEEFSGMSMDIPEIPNPLFKPWQLSCPAQPIMTSADKYQC